MKRSLLVLMLMLVLSGCETMQGPNAPPIIKQINKMDEWMMRNWW